MRNCPSVGLLVGSYLNKSVTSIDVYCDEHGVNVDGVNVDSIRFLFQENGRERE